MNALRSRMSRLLARRKTEDHRGQILLIFAFGLIVFIGFAALTVDIGSLYAARRSYQNATDAAALAGAAYLTRPTADPCADVVGAPTKQVCARRAAWGYLNDQLGLGLSAATVDTYANSDTPASGQVVSPGAGAPYSIWVSTPPSGAGTASLASTVRDAKQVVFVRVDRARDVFFGKVFAPQGFTVSAWSTAGIFPNRYAVLTLRRGRGGAEIDNGDTGAEDIKISGGSHLDVVNGDVGGNFGMRVDGSSGTSLRIYSNPAGDDANIYLTDYLSCGNSCWNSAQVTDLGGTPVPVKKLPAFVADPGYAAPPGLNATAPNGPMLSGSLTIPQAQGTDAQGDLTVSNNDTSGVTADNKTCNAGVKQSIIGPGWYRNIDIAGSQCIILSGNRQRTQFNDSSTETDIPATQQPGIVYITGDLRIGNNALIVGDGVTVVMRPSGSNSQFSPNGVLDLNTGKATGTAQKLGGWTTKSIRPYSLVAGKWQYQSSLEGDLRTNGVGLAFYVLAPDQYSTGNASDANTSVIRVSSTGSGMAWLGVTYAPRDNVTMSGALGHDGFGQLVSWTFTFTGGTLVKQTYDGPGDGFPYLIEPCVQSGGACQ